MSPCSIQPPGMRSTSPWLARIPSAVVTDGRRAPTSAASVLCASAISRAEDPVAMAQAIRLGTEGGRLAYRAGRIPRRLYAQASTPEEGVAEF